MGRHYPDEIAERRRVKRSERQDVRADANEQAMRPPHSTIYVGPLRDFLKLCDYGRRNPYERWGITLDTVVDVVVASDDIRENE